MKMRRDPERKDLRDPERTTHVPEFTQEDDGISSPHKSGARPRHFGATHCAMVVLHW